MLGGVLLASQSFAADDKPLTEQWKNDLSDINKRLATLESQQKEIIAKEDKILEELDRVRIWVHKR